MDYMITGGVLLYEWIKTLIIFALIDRILIRKRIREILKTHDTYLSSLVVAAFLLLIRHQKITLGLFIIWSVCLLFIYIFLKAMARIFFKL